jgi:hypothetical protein
MARQTQKGKGFGGEVKGALFSDTQGRKYVPLIGDLNTVTLPGTAPTQGPHLICTSSATPLMGI